MNRSRPPRRLNALLASGIALGTLALWWPATRNGFINFDDPEYVVANPMVNGGLTAAGARWAFDGFRLQNYHPLTILSHMADAELFGLDPRGHHATSVALHAANAALLFAVLAAFSGAAWRSALAAALFAAHPLRAESVAWVAERKDVLSTLFLLLGLAAYLRYARRRGRGAYAVALAALALGLLAKPMLVSFPLVLLLLDYWPLGRLRLDGPARGRLPPALLLEKLPFLALAAASGVLTLLAQQRGGALATVDEFPLGVRLMNGALSAARYLGQALWPADLAVHYPHPGADVSRAGVAAAGLLLAVLTAAALAASRRRPALTAGWLWYLATLLPVLGLVQVGLQAMADRYTYVPLIGVGVAGVWGLADGLRRTRVPAAAVALGAAGALVALGAATRAYLPHWRDGVTLFTRALAVTGGSPTIHNNLGTALAARGRLGEALPHLQAAARMRPGNGRYRFNLATALAAAGRDAEAESEFRQAIAQGGESAGFRVNLAVLLARNERVAEGIDLLFEEVALNPRNDLAHFNLSLLLGAAGRPAEAQEHRRIALALNPRLAQAGGGRRP